MAVRALLLLGVTGVVSLSAQTIYSKSISGLRVNGSVEARFPLATLDSNPVTISFDIDDTFMKNYHIKMIHCDKDWNVTQSSFVNDDFRNVTRNQIPFITAPFGVKKYRWTYSLCIPGTGDNNNLQAQNISGSRDFEKLQQSGNYKFEVWNDDLSELLAEGKLFVAEKIEDSTLTIYNRYLPSEISPKNQVNKAVLSFGLPAPEKNDLSPYYLNYIKTVDIYRNREIESPHRIDVDDQNPNTYIEGFGTNDLIFVIDNLQPGNEYRRIDLRNADLYPPDEILRPRNGVDLSRWLWQGARSMSGTSQLVTDNRYADYVQFRFELGRPEENTHEKIYVVGDFNGWKVDDRWQMEYDPVTKLYTLLAWLRRGAFDYQYVLTGNDWIALEGNDWRTINVYTALLYYHDMRYGGFDRILLAAQKKSFGETQATSQ